MKICYLVTDPLTAFRLMEGQLTFMRERGVEVCVISAPGPLLDRVAEREGVRTIGVPMQRAIAPGQDLASLARGLRLSLFDVSYFALALDQGWPLASRDETLLTVAAASDLECFDLRATVK